MVGVLSHLTTYNYLYTLYLKVGFHIEKMNILFFNKIISFSKNLNQYFSWSIMILPHEDWSFLDCSLQ
jgi:hypothetical protein